VRRGELYFPTVIPAFAQGCPGNFKHN
jgi:hypothetical protein